MGFLFGSYHVKPDNACKLHVNMSITIKHALNTRRQKQDGTYPLVLRLIYNRSVVDTSTGYAINKKDWDSRNQAVRSTTKLMNNVTRINNILQQQRANAFDRINELSDSGLLLSMKASEILTMIKDNRPSKSVYFFEFLNLEISSLRKARRVGTAETYEDLSKKILVLTKGDLTLKFNQIDYSFLMRLENAHLSKGSNLGSLGVYMRTLRAIYNKAIKKGVAKLDEYPFSSYTIKKWKSQRKSLNIQNVRALLEFHSSRVALNTAVKYYLLSFYMQGMNWMDICLLRGGNINVDQQRINYSRHKTGKNFSIKILPQMTSLIEELSNKEIKGIKKEEYVFPIITQEYLNMIPERIKSKRRKLNKYLKEVADLISIDSFTIYTARHTWATLSKRNGARTAVIQEGLGHQTEEMTQTYLNEFENEVLDVHNENLFNSINNIIND